MKCKMVQELGTNEELLFFKIFFQGDHGKEWPEKFISLFFLCGLNRSSEY